MPSERKFLASFILGISAVLVVVYALIPFFVKKDLLETALQTSLRPSGIELEYEKLSFQAFPVLTAVLEDVRVEYHSNKLKAEKIKIALRFPHYFQGKVIPSGIQVQKGDLKAVFSSGPLHDLHFQDFFASVKNIGQGQAIRFNFKSSLPGAEKGFSAKGFLRIPHFNKFDLETVLFDAKADLKKIPAEIFAASWRPEEGFMPVSGLLDGNFRFNKKSGENALFVKGSLETEKFIYSTLQTAALQPLPMDASADLDLIWDLKDSFIRLQKNSLSFPFGRVDLRGGYHATEKSFKGMQISLRDFSLDLLPHYYLPLKESIPLSLGFSGQSEVEITLDGRADELTIHGDWTMTPMLLTYAKYFSKPKEFPASLDLNFLLKNGQDLSGDFTFFLGDSVLKGAFSKLNLLSGEGEMNVISNKFSITGWERMVLPLEDYVLGGHMKILANFNGNILRRPEDLKTMVNLTLDRASMLNHEGKGFQKISLSLDFAPVSLELTNADFEIGRSSFNLSAKVLNPLREPEVSLKAAASAVYPAEFLAAIQAVNGKKFSQKLNDRFNYFTQLAQNVFGQDEAVKNVSAVLSCKSGVWTLLDFQSQVLSGALKAKGDYTEVSQTYRINAQVDRFDVSQFGAQKSPARPSVEGNLFLTFDGFGQVSDSEWQRKISGEGSLSLTAGSFSSVDLMAGLADIPELSEVQKFANGQTRFNDIHAQYKVTDGRLVTDKLDLIGAEISAKGAGNLSLVDGSLNYGLDLFLSAALSEEIFEKMQAVDGQVMSPQLGPVPFLLAGRFEDLQLKADPDRIGEFQENFQKKKTYKVFSSFLPEDVLLGRPTSS